MEIKWKVAGMTVMPNLGDKANVVVCANCLITAVDGDFKASTQMVSKYIQGNLIWYGLAPLMARKHGFVPAKKLKWGSDDETRKSHYQSMQWAKRKPWVDSDDGFDYAKALQDIALPPIFHVAGIKDKALCQPIDIEKFMAESGVGVQTMTIYGRKYGHKVNYDHINMLTHPEARHDQFADLLEWFSAHSQGDS